MSLQELRQRGLGSGTTLHVVAYPGNVHMVVDKDPISHAMFPLNVTTPSNEVSVTIP